VTRVLLDTHAFIWWFEESPLLSPAARQAITDAAEGFLSLASCWEMAIKVGNGKLKLVKPLERLVPEQLGLNAFSLLPIDLDDVVRVAVLPPHHRDPFDRMLAAQALNDDLAVVSADPVFTKYGVKRIW
jgi:PIN domain nuclease of toxin-antitoxin system